LPASAAFAEGRNRAWQLMQVSMVLAMLADSAR
jgi:hypothetical protein